MQFKIAREVKQLDRSQQQQLDTLTTPTRKRKAEDDLASNTSRELYSSYYRDKCAKTARHNRANHATCPSEQLDSPFAQGAFRWCAKGTYTEGERKGESCVIKWFKDKSNLSEEFFKDDIDAVDKALELIRQFNAAGITGKTVRLNIPTVWTWCSGRRIGQKNLCEPFIENCKDPASALPSRSKPIRVCSLAPRLFVPAGCLGSLGVRCCTRAQLPRRHKVQFKHGMDERPGDSAVVGGQRPPRLVGANAGPLALLVPHQWWRPAALRPPGWDSARRHRDHPDRPGRQLPRQEVRSNRPRRQGDLNLLRQCKLLSALID